MHAKGSTWAHWEFARAISVPSYGENQVRFISYLIFQTPYLTSTSISSPFCRSRWAMNEVESLRLGGAADATDLAGGSSKENEEEKT